MVLFPVHPLLLSPTSLRTLLIRLYLYSPTHSLPSSFQYFSYALWTVLPSSFIFNCLLQILRSSTRSAPTLLIPLSCPTEVRSAIDFRTNYPTLEQACWELSNFNIVYLVVKSVAQHLCSEMAVFWLLRIQSTSYVLLVHWFVGGIKSPERLPVPRIGLVDRPVLRESGMFTWRAFPPPRSTGFVYLSTTLSQPLTDINVLILPDVELPSIFLMYFNLSWTFRISLTILQISTQLLYFKFSFINYRSS